MNRKKPAAHLEDLPELFDEKPYAEWFRRHGKTLLYILIAVLILIVLAFRYTASSSQEMKRDFMLGDSEYLAFQRQARLSASDEKWKEHLSKLEQILQQHPELRPKYEGGIAQTLLILGDTERAASFANRIFHRTSFESLKNQKEFGQNALTISAQKYSDALQQAEDLQERLKPDSPILFTLNLLRITSLQSQLHMVDEVKKSRELLITLIQSGNFEGEIFDSEKIAELKQKIDNGTGLFLQYLGQNVSIED